MLRRLKTVRRGLTSHIVCFSSQLGSLPAEGKDSYFVLSCMDRNEGYAVPYPLLDKNKNLNTSEKGDKSYWHVATNTLDDGSLAINLSRIGAKLSLKTFAFVGVLLPPEGTLRLGETSGSATLPSLPK